mmetsp:Transcript_46889/g.146960  ORF Transcript_46889/g.146960 Transcript_46889/m.146960 type:complete len:283 (+) Transcript_46889:2806-3654(+)
MRGRGQEADHPRTVKKRRQAEHGSGRSGESARSSRSPLCFQIPLHGPQDGAVDPPARCQARHLPRCSPLLCSGQSCEVRSCCCHCQHPLLVRALFPGAESGSRMPGRGHRRDWHRGNRGGVLKVFLLQPAESRRMLLWVRAVRRARQHACPPLPAHQDPRSSILKPNPPELWAVASHLQKAADHPSQRGAVAARADRCVEHDLECHHNAWSWRWRSEGCELKGVDHLLVRPHLVVCQHVEGKLSLQDLALAELVRRRSRHNEQTRLADRPHPLPPLRDGSPH